MTTRRLVSLPMYAVPKPHGTDIADALRARLAERGFRPEWTEPSDLEAHWCDPGLLLSQTCGYPLTHALAGRVRVVATPTYDAPGCVGPLYSSAVVVRESDPADGIGALRGRRVAFNSEDSQSGHNALLAAVAPLAVRGRFFGGAVRTGSHAASMDAVLGGRADAAAIDAVTLALRSDAEPGLALRTVARTPAAPSLPFVTAASATPDEVAAIRSALLAVLADDGLREALAAARWSGLETLPADAYSVILRQKEEARALGCLALA